MRYFRLRELFDSQEKKGDPGFAHQWVETAGIQRV